MDPDRQEHEILQLGDLELIYWLMDHDFIKKEVKCDICGAYKKLQYYKYAKQNYIWRCTSMKCDSKRKRDSISKGSFFDGFDIDIRIILKIIIRWSCNQQRSSILANICSVSKNTICKVIDKLVGKMSQDYISLNKLGGGNKLVQVDEIMMNYKCNSPRAQRTELML